MIKQLIAATTLLQIQNVPETIHYARAIFDFTMLA